MMVCGSLFIFPALISYKDQLSLTISIPGEQRSERYIAIKGKVFDVTRNVAAYGPGTKYSVLLGRDASRALGKSSLKPEDIDPTISDDISDFTDKQKQVLEDWFSFFSQRSVFFPSSNASAFTNITKRYNIVGNVVS
jgi:predicted heme/steroid binding protein